MIIESLRMKNFKSHLDSQIDFNTGISIIMGGNGAGKSSILEAVSFALFKQHSGKKIEQLVTIGQKKMFVELKFTSNGRTYCVSRERSKNSSKARLSIEEDHKFHPISSGDKQVTGEVQSLLEMDGDLFLNAVYVRQGEIADLVDKTSAEKKQVIGKLLGIESLEKAWKNMLTIMKDYETEQIKLEAKLEELEGLNDDIKSKKSEKIEIQENISKIELMVNETQAKLDLIIKEKQKFDKDKETYERAITSLKSKNNILDNLISDNNHLNSQINEILDKEKEIEIIKPKLSKLNILKQLKTFLSSLKQSQNDEKQLKIVLDKIRIFNEIIQKNKKFYNDYSLLSDELTNLEKEKSKYDGSRALFDQQTTLKKEILGKMGRSHDKIVKVINGSNKVLETNFSLIEELETYIKTKKPAVEKSIEDMDLKINKAKQEIYKLENQNKDLKKPLTELGSVKEKCPICESPISSEKREELIKNYSAQIKTNETQIFNLIEGIKALKMDKAEINKNYSNLQSINIEVLKEQLETLHEGQKELKNLKDKIDNLKIEVSHLESIENQIKEQKDTIRGIKPKYEVYLETKGSLESLGDPAENRNNLEKTRVEICGLKEQISSIIEVTGGSIENLDEEIEYLEDMKSRYQHLTGAVALKSSLTNRIDEVQLRINDVEEEIKNLNKEIKTLAHDEEPLHKLNEDLASKTNQLNELKGKKQELIGREIGINNSLEDLQKKIESYNTYLRKVKNLKDFLKLLNYIRDLYGKDGVQKDLRNISRPLIEQKTREFFEKFNFEYSDIKLDEDYDVTVYGPNGESSLDMISGGEKIAVALALRLGITQTLSGGSLELIMLDEPTIHLDAYRRQELIDLLKKMSIIPQMIIVTHDTDLEDAADNIFRVKKEDGESIIYS
jgi:DNA repair protein SbcC/Rad50